MHKLISSVKEAYREESSHESKCNSTKQYTRLALVQKDKRYSSSVKERMVVNRMPLQQSDLFLGKESKPVKKVLIEGDAGIGKTTLCTSMSCDWANEKLFQEFELLLFVPLRSSKVASAMSLSELLQSVQIDPNICHSDAVAAYFEEGKGGQVLFILDGWDEYPHLGGSTFLKDLVCHGLPCASVIVTSRPSVSHNLQHFDRHVEVCGFTNLNIEEYISSELGRGEEKADRLIRQLKDNPQIESLCSVPLNCAMMCSLWKSVEETLPTTMTELYTKFILNLIQRNVEERGSGRLAINDLKSLPHGLQQSWLLLCKFAFQALQKNQTVFSQDDIRGYFPQGSSSDVVTFGLLKSTKTVSNNSYSFLHLTFQEYLAAIYITSQRPNTLRSVIEDSHQYLGGTIWRFIYGIHFSRKQALKINDDNEMQEIFQVISNHAKDCSNIQRNLWHCSLEANHKHVKSAMGLFLHNSCLVDYPITTHDFIAAVYAINSIQDSNIAGMVIKFSNCGNGNYIIRLLVDTLSGKHGKFQVKELELSYDGLDDDTISFLVQKALFASQPSLRKLCLAGNCIQNKGVMSIIAGLTNSNSCLTHLDLSYNPLGPLGVQTLANAICTNKLMKLESLILRRSLTSNIEVNDALLEKLMDRLLYHCPDLSVLDLSENDLGTSGAVAIGRNVSGSQEFYLQLNDTKICDASLIALIEALEFPCQFHLLALSSNNIGITGTSHLADAMCAGKILSISELNLIGNPLGLEGTKAISKVFRTSGCCQISRLSLSGCYLTTAKEDVASLDMAGVLKNVGEHLCQMVQAKCVTWLDLDNNNFSGSGILILAGFIHLCQHLQHLSSNSCGITPDDFKHLIDRLKQVEKVNTCSSLQTWDLGNNCINDSAVFVLFNQISSLFPSIQSGGMSLHNNPVSVQVIKSLEEEIKRNTEVISSDILLHHKETKMKVFFVGSTYNFEDKPEGDVTLVNIYRICKSSETQSKFQELTTTLNQCSSHIVLIEGRTGAGKSTLVNHLICHKSLKGYQMLLYFQYNNNVHTQRMQTIKEIADELKTTESQLCNSIEDAQTHVLIVLDGFDEFVKKESWKNTVFARILLRRIFPLASILVLSRPSGMIHLKSYVCVDHHFQLKGLPIDNPSNSLSPLKVQYQWAVVMCEQHPSLMGLCEIPLISELVYNYFLQKCVSSDTITDIVKYIVVKLMEREMRRQDQQVCNSLDLLDLPNNMLSDFMNVCKLAFESLINRNILTNSDQVERFISSFNLKTSFSLSENETFGLVERVSYYDYETDEKCRIEFLHPLIQEFLAGYYLHLQPPLDQLVLIHQHLSQLVGCHHCQHHSLNYVLLFFFGLSWQRSHELDLNPTKLMFNTLIEFLASCLEVKKADISKSCLMFVLSIAETKDNELWKKFVAKLGGDLSLKLSSNDIKKHKWTIANMVSFSQVSEWNIFASNFSTAKELELYIGVRLNKLEVTSMDPSIIKLTPKLSIEAASKRQMEIEKFTQDPDKFVALMNHFQCRAVREILQRAFAMYTISVRLKGDASNPAYVSFLSCGCFQRNLEKNLAFDPPIPFHFLQVTSQKTLSKLQEHSLHLATEHDGKAMELVILLKPCMRRITLTYKSNVHHIVIMSEELARQPQGKGAITCMVAELGNPIENVIKCTEESVSSAKSQMVRPSLPLPPKIEQNLRATTVLPQIITPETSQTPMIHPIMHREQEHEKPPQPQVRESSQAQLEKVYFEKSFGSNSVHSFPTISENQKPNATVTPTQQTLHTRTNIKPGTILFTFDPKQIPADHIHSLPDESHRMRRGGNGQIFSGTICGMDVVYKKTNYRSREHKIITKIKHKNIVKLMAFMYGTENPAHKKRHFCYHVMPRLSGDCARMLTDKEELTVKELNKKHGDNIRKMGIIRGNLKYLLKEVLQGLRYLHSLHIAHRDIKGSNILLKFFCSCTNPIECGCDTKYQVQICDYDAAVELDEYEQLPCTLLRLKTSFKHYVSIPVGTNGFRSPECSMLTITNFPNAFSPPITTRCDIWAIGILTVRILIGVIGPNSQRAMALLLLHYHQQRYMHEGLHKYGYLKVDRLVTDKLLNEKEFSKSLGVSNLSLNEREVFIVWKWTWEDKPPSPTDGDTLSSQSDKEEHVSEDMSEVEGQSSEPDCDVSDIVTHSLVFKCIGSTKSTHYQDTLSKAAHMIDEGKTVPIRVRPEPDNPVDSKAIAFECKLDIEWKIIGYVVCEALDALHDALNNSVITETKIDWIKYIVHWSRSGPGWYAGIRITKRGKWPKEAIQCASTQFC